VKGNGKSEGTAIPIQAWAGREGCTRLRLPELVGRRHMKMVSCQPQEPAAFTRQEITLVLISVRG